jgi:hypothetical protein
MTFDYKARLIPDMTELQFVVLHIINWKWSEKTATLSSVDYVWKLCFYVAIIQRTCLFSDDFYSDSTLILTIAAK